MAEKKKPKKAEEQTQSKAVILNFRRGKRTMTPNQLLLAVDGVFSSAKASLYIGKRVVWKSPGRERKEIYGKITQTHGNNGVLRARFSRGLPGTALGARIDILEKQ